MKKMPKKRLAAAIIFIILAVAVAVTIFVLSSEGEALSDLRSGGVTEAILSVLGVLKGLDGQERRAVILQYNFLVRSVAHVVIFFVLALVSCFFWKFLGVKRPCLITLITSLVYAVLDEIHQIFVPGRTFEFEDILLDLLGITLAVVLFSLIIYLKRKKGKGDKT